MKTFFFVLLVLFGLWFAGPIYAADEAAKERPDLSPAPSQATGFTVRRVNDVWWLVAPNGQRFLSRGICVMNPGVDRESFRADNPSYAAWQHYSSTREWADTGLKRLKRWRFTTIGGWSDDKQLAQSPANTLWFTPVLHLGSTAGIP